ncbi:hypothetical protein N7510_005719 [Penicillium lagena]|uniref:uncharacterized protein n=1 Tax=Penicillium lagena TaxID=94218 RepID=UPI002540459F|nr:uncharacterized protein N7510_005719 [Penicillium lagena]KAJ5612525.1 hypothetical protein N7510_005719 [Penicillium lagena]
MASKTSVLGLRSMLATSFSSTPQSRHDSRLRSAYAPVTRGEDCAEIIMKLFRLRQRLRRLRDELFDELPDDPGQLPIRCRPSYRQFRH